MKSRLNLAVMATGLLLSISVTAADHDGGPAKGTETPAKAKLTWEVMQARARELTVLLGNKSRVQTGMVHVPDEVYKMKGNPMAAAEYQMSRQMLGMEKLEALIKKGVVTPGHFKMIVVGEQISGPDFHGNLFISWKPSLEELEKFFKELPSPEEMRKVVAAAKRKMSGVTAKTGVHLQISGQLTAKEAGDFADRLAKILAEPETQGRAVAGVNMHQYKGQNSYAEDSQSLSLHNGATDDEIRKIIASAKPATSPALLAEMERLRSLTKNADAQKIMDDKIAELKRKATEPLRQLNIKSAQAEEHLGMRVFFSDKVQSPTPVEKKLAVLDTLLGIPKDRLPTDRAANSIAISGDYDIGMTMDGSIYIRHEASGESVLKALNAAPERTAWAREKERLLKKMEDVSTRLGDKLRITPDFENNNTTDDFRNAVATLEKLADDGFQIDSKYPVIYFTGSHVKGWEGAKPSFGGIVMRADATVDDLRKYFTKK